MIVCAINAIMCIRIEIENLHLSLSRLCLELKKIKKIASSLKLYAQQMCVCVQKLTHMFFVAPNEKESIGLGWGDYSLFLIILN